MLVEFTIFLSNRFAGHLAPVLWMILQQISKQPTIRVSKTKSLVNLPWTPTGTMILFNALIPTWLMIKNLLWQHLEIYNNFWVVHSGVMIHLNSTWSTDFLMLTMESLNTFVTIAYKIYMSSIVTSASTFCLELVESWLSCSSATCTSVAAPQIEKVNVKEIDSCTMLIKRKSKIDTIATTMKACI